MARIIVIEPDAEQNEHLLSQLTIGGHNVRGVLDGDQLAQCLSRFIPEIVLIDVRFGSISHKTPIHQQRSFAIIRELHQHFGTALGIIAITAANDIDDRIESRIAGADHYMVKPVIGIELLALIDNLTRRLTPSSRDQAWRLFANEAMLSVPEYPAIPLTGWEVVVLTALASAPDQQISRATLIEAIGRNPDVYDPRALEAGVSRLRKKLPSISTTPALQAIRGYGYRFNHPLAIVR